ncbi:hypothetical protein [Sutcliffiella cohnii]|uniref:hypothetical protein n=1 Tax=Sutcliffiella cohnii TaxID=33932 RepID=UPI00082A6105|nr:hypothetical protein [Sutcliffiella cohnii]
MRDLLIMGAFALALWVFVRIILKEPILPWMAKEDQDETPLMMKKRTSKTEKQNDVEEPEPEIFKNMFSDIKGISDHMIRYKNNRFVLISEVEPVNYFLLSQDEQEAIDSSFERWLATLDYNVQWYLQNRYVDLSEPIEEMRKNMIGQDDLPPNAIQYGKDLIDDLVQWQSIAPRYETKRYLVFVYQVDAKQITAEDKEELEEKIVEKAFAELYRRFNSAKSALRKANINMHLLTSEGIVEVLYYAFNRRKAIKNKFKDIRMKEMLSLYVTADQDSRRIEMVKEMIDSETFRKEEKAG